MFFFVMGLSMTTRSGYYLLNLIDNYTCTLPIIFISTLEAVGLGWIYGVKRIEENIKSMLNIKLNLYWKITIKYVTPVIAIVVCFITIMSNEEPKLGDYVYPSWAHIIGNIIVVTCLAPLLIVMILQLQRKGVFKVIWEKMNPVCGPILDSFQPSASWGPAYDDDDVSSGSSANDSNQGMDQNKKYKNKNNQQYSSVKLQRITESKAQIIFQNTDEED